MANGLKSPIKARPLRQAGQSGRETLDDILSDKVATWITITTFVWMITGLEWYAHVKALPRVPGAYLIVASLLTIVAAIRVFIWLRRARRVRLGLDGEKVVGEYLDRLRVLGYRVFHDIQHPDGQIDHLIICQRGVFTVETKTRRKPKRGEPIVLFDGETVSVNGGKPDAEPIRQALGQAASIKTLLKELTGHSYSVQPTLLFPGWFVRTMPGCDWRVWALNPKALHKFVEKSKVHLSREQVAVASASLSKYMRQ